MENLFIGCLGVVILLLLLVLQTPVGFALGFVGVLGYAMVMTPTAALAVLGVLPFGSLAVYAFMTVPLFIIMGMFLEHSDMGEELFKTGNLWFGNLRGGLIMATLFASAAFGAASGSSLANSAIFSRLAIPQMVKAGVDKRFAAGAVAAVGTVDAMIPPSITMVIYCIITNVSIAQTLIAGIIPGIFTVLVYAVMVYVRVYRNPSLAPLRSSDVIVTWRARFSSLKGLWGILALFILVLGGIYIGMITPTEGGGIGAAGALILTILTGRFSFRRTIKSLLDAGNSTSQVFFIILGGLLFSRFLSITGVAGGIIEWVASFDINRYAIVVGIVLLYAVLGCFLDATSMMIITLPIVFPIIKKLGFDGVWFGIIVTMSIELGLITPPLGLNVYVVKSASPVPLSLGEVFQGVIWFVVMDLVILAILISFPQISLFLPSLMGPS